MTVTDGRGTPIPGVHVTLAGPSDRGGDTDSDGRVNFVRMQAGTYRVRFDGKAVTPFERELAVRAGRSTAVDVTLNPAPPPPPPPPAPAPAAPPPAALPVLGPAGTPQILSVVDLAEEQLEKGQGRAEALVACSGNTRTTVVGLLNQDQPERVNDAAETAYYVVAGQGTVRINGRDTSLSAGTFVSLPRKTAYSIARRGNRPLILLATLSGEPCQDAK